MGGQVSLGCVVGLDAKNWAPGSIWFGIVIVLLVVVQLSFPIVLGWKCQFSLAGFKRVIFEFPLATKS